MSSTLLRLPSARFQLFHELGHLVDIQGLSPRGRRAFARAFRAAPGWKRCFPKRSGRGCSEMTEVFANQFACWAAGVRRVPRTSNYLTPCLLPARTMERLLVREYAFRPQLVTEFTW